jgi:competence protein ComEC
MNFCIAIFLIIMLSASPLKNNVLRNFTIVWNVGQGQWVTALLGNECLHFDAGGEFFPWKKISRVCSRKSNKLFLSHWDWDHIGALSHWPKWPSCIALHPLGQTTKRKSEILGSIPDCSSPTGHHMVAPMVWTPSSDAEESNAKSHVVLFKNFLMPGDSPKEQELHWKNQSWILHTRILVLGHHGSHTSTSPQLLSQLPHLKMAIASARWKRYHHPHAEIEALLKQRHIPMIRTEDWGNIWFEN